MAEKSAAKAKRDAEARRATVAASKAARQSLVFVYKPEGVPEEKWQRWPFEPGRFDNDEAEAIEDETGWTFAHWQDMFFAGSMRAIHAALWVFLRRTRADLEYGAVKFMDCETDLVWPELPAETPAASVEGGEEGKAPAEETGPETAPGS